MARSTLVSFESSKIYLFAPLAIAAAGWIAYCNSFQGVFLLDDRPLIVDNPAIRQLTPVSKFIFGGGLRKLPMASFALNYAIVDSIPPDIITSTSPSICWRSELIWIAASDFSLLRLVTIPAKTGAASRIPNQFDLGCPSAQHASRQLHRATHRVDDGISFLPLLAAVCTCLKHEQGGATRSFSQSQHVSTIQPATMDVTLGYMVYLLRRSCV